MFTIEHAREAAVFTVGVPFRKGILPPDVRTQAVVNGDAVSFWSDVRSHWPDGSVKWLWTHVPVPAGTSMLEFITSGKNASPAAAPVLREKKDCWSLILDGCVLTLRKNGTFSFENQNQSWQCAADKILFSPGFTEKRPDPLEVELLEPSFLAPLVRVRKTVPERYRLEYLFRMVPSTRELAVWRRITLLSTKKCLLRAMKLELVLKNANRWEMPGQIKGMEIRLAVLKHGKWLLNDREKDGFPELFLRNSQGSIYLEKGWQRFPVGLHAAGKNFALHLFPDKAPMLQIWPGTSFRHRFHLRLGPSVRKKYYGEIRWKLDPEYFTRTEVLGPLVPCTEETRRLFPGYEMGYETSFANIRKTKLDEKAGESMGEPASLAYEERHAPEYFGLQHYGDWPLELGRYSGPEPDHRAYADNEYDAPFGFLQQFARTGEWVYYNLSREGVVHMADVDMDMLRPAMFYHGYMLGCEDHDFHRPTPGIGDHSWTDSLWNHYFISGDYWAKEVAEAIAGVLLNKFKDPDGDTLLTEWSHCERTIGWTMVQMSANVEARGDHGELAVCHHLAAFLHEAMRAPDLFVEKHRKIGGKSFKWWRTGGIDGCKTFMLGICLEGLERYHCLSGDVTAIKAMTMIAEFLVEVMWHPNTGMFTYEHNAYHLQHRNLMPSGALLVVRSLAYLYDQTKVEKYREVARASFFAAQWVFVSPQNVKSSVKLDLINITSARELAQFTRSSNAMVYWLRRWEKEEIARKAQSVPVADAVEICFSGTPEEFMRFSQYHHRSGQPAFLADGSLYTTPRFTKDALLTEDGESFLDGEFIHPVANDFGEAFLTFTPHWPGDNQGGCCQRGLLYLADNGLNVSAVSLITFYGKLCLRIYDAAALLILSLETKIVQWPENRTHEIGFSWNRNEIFLAVDGEIQDRARLSRSAGGAFRRIIVGAHPVIGASEGVVHHLKIRFGNSGQNCSSGMAKCFVT